MAYKFNVYISDKLPRNDAEPKNVVYTSVLQYKDSYTLRSLGIHIVNHEALV